jgi:hypothetical protein
MKPNSGWIAIIYGGSYSRFAIKPERHDLARDGGGDRNSAARRFATLDAMPVDLAEQRRD